MFSNPRMRVISSQRRIAGLATEPSYFSIRLMRLPSSSSRSSPLRNSRVRRFCSRQSVTQFLLAYACRFLLTFPTAICRCSRHAAAMRRRRPRHHTSLNIRAIAGATLSGSKYFVVVPAQCGGVMPNCSVINPARIYQPCSVASSPKSESASSCSASSARMKLAISAASRSISARDMSGRRLYLATILTMRDARYCISSVSK